MTETVTIVISAVKFGYDRYGPKGAVAAAAAVGASLVIVKKLVPRYTNVDEEHVEELYGKVTDDDELTEILGEEFTKRFGDHVDVETGDSPS